jgi:hypothetical protein
LSAAAKWSDHDAHRVVTDSVTRDETHILRGFSPRGVRDAHVARDRQPACDGVR